MHSATNLVSWLAELVFVLESCCIGRELVAALGSGGFVGIVSVGCNTEEAEVGLEDEDVVVVVIESISVISPGTAELALDENLVASIDDVASPDAVAVGTFCCRLGDLFLHRLDPPAAAPPPPSPPLTPPPSSLLLPPPPPLPLELYSENPFGDSGEPCTEGAAFPCKGLDIDRHRRSTNKGRHCNTLLGKTFIVVPI